jgi:hypothetical protein
MCKNKLYYILKLRPSSRMCMSIKIAENRNGCFFVDKHGRQVILRGVNLGGDSKVPFPYGGTHFPSNFSDHYTVSFVGRPFPLSEAEQHFERIRSWGFNTVRLLVTWEAVAHAGPKTIDKSFLSYFRKICEIAEQFDLYIFIDFHQDAFSRMSGGDGAPGWVFEKLGIDFTRLSTADCAHVMQYKYDYLDDDKLQTGYAPMSWSSNYNLPLNKIVWTLFWGGHLCTPNFLIDGQNVKDFLHEEYFFALEAICKSVSDLNNIIGIEPINEPNFGFWGETLTDTNWEIGQSIVGKQKAGLHIEAASAILIAAGYKQTVPVTEKKYDTGSLQVVEKVCLNPNGLSIWRLGCPFEASGLYDLNQGPIEWKNPLVFLENTYESSSSSGMYKDFYIKARVLLDKYCKGWLLFCELDPFDAVTGVQFPESMPDNSVNAGHWYDLSILYEKDFDAENHRDFLTGTREHGRSEIKARYERQILQVCKASQTNPRMPILLGEVGVPMDLQQGKDYQCWRIGDVSKIWQKQKFAMSLMYDVLDKLRLSSMHWNYTASNRNALNIGDGWNQEDLSIFSRDQLDEHDSITNGARGLEGFSRPYIPCAQGLVYFFNFDSESKKVFFEIEIHQQIEAPTVLFLPTCHYPLGVQVKVEDENFLLYQSSQKLIFFGLKSGLYQGEIVKFGEGAFKFSISYVGSSSNSERYEVKSLCGGKLEQTSAS